MQLCPDLILSYLINGDLIILKKKRDLIIYLIDGFSGSLFFFVGDFAENKVVNYATKSQALLSGNTQLVVLFFIALFLIS